MGLKQKYVDACNPSYTGPAQQGNPGQTVEQFQARAAELEAENARLQEQVDLQIPKMAFTQLKDENSELRQQLILAQSEIKRLKELLRSCCHHMLRSKEADQLSIEAAVMYAQPSDTSTLDAYVAKIKDQTEQQTVEACVTFLKEARNATERVAKSMPKKDRFVDGMLEVLDASIEGMPIGWRKHVKEGK